MSPRSEREPLPHEISRHVERFGPSRRGPAPRIFQLEFDQIRPVVRIAQRRETPLATPQRIIFDHELVVVLEGRGELCIGDRHYEVAPRQMFLIRPFVPHVFVAAPGRRHDHLGIHFDWSPRVPTAGKRGRDRVPYEVSLRGVAQIPEHLTLVPADPLVSAGLALVQAHATGTALGRFEASAYLTAILAQLLSRPQPTEADPPRTVDRRAEARMRQVIRWMEEHLSEPISSTDVARGAGMSRSHFNRLFRDWTGFAPMDYLRRQRVEKARHLLSSPDLSVKEIAARTGFGDAFHFSKVFRQIDGLSPSQYREAVLTDQGIIDPRAERAAKS